MKISGIILTKDGNVARAKKSLSFCDEVLVIRNENITDFAKVRNDALKKVKCDWVFFLDDDEVISPALSREIRNIQFAIYNGYYLKRRDVLFGKEIKYGEIGNIKLLRFARKDAGGWKRRVHEFWNVKGKTGELKNPIIHYPHQTLREFIDNIKIFSSLHARENITEGKNSSLLKIIFWPRLKFLNTFIIKLGFLDGMRGFIIALMMSFHSFLAWSEQWLIQNRKK